MSSSGKPSTEASEKVCPAGSMCPNKQTCPLFHPTRVPRRPLNAEAASFVPAQSTEPIPEQPVTPSPTQPKSNQTVSTTNEATSETISLLSASATPFKPTLPITTPVPHPNEYIHGHDNSDYGDYFDSEDESYDSEEDEDDEFDRIVERLHNDPTHANDSHEEIEALANEIFYGLHFQPDQKSPQTQAPTQQAPLPQTQVYTEVQTHLTSEGKKVCACCSGNPVQCEGSPLCVSRDVCICVDDEVDHAKSATWVVASRLCTCCKGFIYRCQKKAPTCTSECDCRAVLQANS